MTSSRTAIEQQMYDEGHADASHDPPFPPQPPAAGGKLAAAYNDGYEAGRPEPDDDQAHEPKQARGSARRPGGTGRARGKASRNRPKKGRSRTGRSTRQIAREVRLPVANKVTGLLPAMGLSIGIALFYNALNSAPEATKFFGGIRRGMEWLEDPTKSIPYGRS